MGSTPSRVSTVRGVAVRMRKTVGGTQICLTRERLRIVARYHNPTPEELAAWNAWVESRPENVRDLARRLDPWTLYRLKSSGHRVTIYAIDEHNDEPVTLRVNVTGAFNLVAFERCVFGISPGDLEECELPAADEPLGSANLSVEQVKERMARRSN